MKFSLDEFEITLPNGLVLPCVAVGDPRGTPLLMLHGYTDSWRSFEPLLPHLPSSIRAIAFTQRGHGDASKPISGYRPQDFASDLNELMDALELEAAVVLGHSMGSYIAQCFALDYPSRTLGVVLVGPFLAPKSNPGIAELWTAVSQFEDPISPDFALEFQQSTLAQPVPKMLLNTVTGESLKTPARVWRAALQELRKADHIAQLGRIQAPTLVVWGDRDGLFTRADQEALQLAIPNAELLVYQGAGHALHWEEPERFGQDVSNFVQGVAARLAA